MSKLLYVFLLLGMVFASARHIHPRPHHVNIDEQWKMEEAQIDGMSVDVLQKVSQGGGLVPVNNIVFFRTLDPCDEGLKRDLFGICREVWDD